MAKTPAWQRKEGKSPSGGLNARGRASLRRQGKNIKRPVSRKQAKKRYLEQWHPQAQHCKKKVLQMVHMQ